MFNADLKVPLSLSLATTVHQITNNKWHLKLVFSLKFFFLLLGNSFFLRVAGQQVNKRKRRKILYNIAQKVFTGFWCKTPLFILTFTPSSVKVNTNIKDTFCNCFNVFHFHFIQPSCFLINKIRSNVCFNVFQPSFYLNIFFQPSCASREATGEDFSKGDLT